MLSERVQRRLLSICVILGLVFAVLSALEGRVGWVDAICTFWGDGCREASQVTLINLPVSIWGIGYYVVLVIASFFLSRWMFYLVMAGAGVEVALVVMMFSRNWVCVFCMANAVVMIACILIVFDSRRIWQTLALASLLFIATDQLLVMETIKGNPENTTDDPIIAQVGQEVIYQSELDESISNQIYRLEGLKYQFRKKQLKPLITERLFAMEAGEKGLTPDDYKETLLKKASVVTEEDVTVYLENNPSVRVNWKGTEDELRQDIQDYIREEKRKEAFENATKELIAKYPVKVLLPPPSLPVSGVSIKEGRSPVIGPSGAPVVVFEFSDYQCPTCRQTHKTSVDLRKKYEGKIRWVFKDFPLAQHKESMLMAQAARCAGDQGRFWEYQDFLYSSEEHPDTGVLEGYARKLDLNMDQFSQCLESGTYQALIQREKDEAKNAGISRTPTFIINKHMNPGKISFDELSELIDHELRKKGVSP